MKKVSVQLNLKVDDKLSHPTIKDLIKVHVSNIGIPTSISINNVETKGK